MANTLPPQKPQSRQNQQNKGRNEQKTHGDVRQDSIAQTRDRIASPQAYRAGKAARSHELLFVSERSQNHSPRRQTVPVTIWATKPIRDQIDEKARAWQVSRSKSALRLVERGLLDNIHENYEAIITGVIREGIASEMKKQQNWRDTLLIRVLFYIAKTCVLATNLVCLLLDTEPKTRDAVLAKSDQKVLPLSRRASQRDGKPKPYRGSRKRRRGRVVTFGVCLCDIMGAYE
jgi:hypothetical protein